MFWKQKRFKDLQHFWYEKLKRDGFKDIEKPSEEITKNAPDYYINAHELVRQNRLEYHLTLNEHVEDGVFDSELDKLVMSYFAEGCPATYIVNELKKAGMSRHRKTLMFIRRKYEHGWGIIHWKPNQLLNSNNLRAKQARNKKR